MSIAFYILGQSVGHLYPLYTHSSEVEGGGYIITLVGEKAIRLNDILIGLGVGLSLEYIHIACSEMAPKSVFSLRRRWSRQDSVARHWGGFVA